MENGYAVMSPIPMGHAILNGAGDTSLKGDFETWRHVCLRMLEASDILCVLTLDGWRDSIGVKAEILHARSLGKPVLFLSYNNGEYFVVPSRKIRFSNQGDIL